MSNDTNSKTTKTRTVSTKYLEKVRESQNWSVEQLFTEMSNFQVENPQPTFQESITAFAAQYKRKGSSGSSALNNAHKEAITAMFAADATPIAGKVVKISSSRKHKDNPNVYSTKIAQDAGTESIVYVDVTDLTAITFEVTGGIRLNSVIDGSQFFVDHQEIENVEQETPQDNTEAVNADGAEDLHLSEDNVDNVEFEVEIVDEIADTGISFTN